jgi:hypothetical protein
MDMSWIESSKTYIMFAWYRYNIELYIIGLYDLYWPTYITSRRRAPRYNYSL